jgi:flagellar assembly factor FliW
MQLGGTRFGEIEVDARKVILLRTGLIGFPGERHFVLLRPEGQSPIAWLQSLKTPALAFPVVEASRIAPPYPAESPEALAAKAGIGAARLSVLVIVSVRARGPKMVANLLAPIVVDARDGVGGQVVLDPKIYSASTPLGSKAELKTD